MGNELINTQALFRIELVHFMNQQKEWCPQKTTSEALQFRKRVQTCIFEFNGGCAGQNPSSS